MKNEADEDLSLDAGVFTLPVSCCFHVLHS